MRCALAGIPRPLSGEELLGTRVLEELTSTITRSRTFIEQAEETLELKWAGRLNSSC